VGFVARVWEINKLRKLSIHQMDKVDFKEIECQRADWIHLAQDMDHWRDVVNTVRVS
jgi:hypothetical protein